MADHGSACQRSSGFGQLAYSSYWLLYPCGQRQGPRASLAIGCLDGFGLRTPGQLVIVDIRSWTTLSTFAEHHLQHGMMPIGSTLRLPYGHLLCLVTLAADAEPSCMVFSPYVVGQLASACPVEDGLVSWSMRLVEANMANGVKPWASVGGQFIAWLKEIHPESVAMASAAGQGTEFEQED